MTETTEKELLMRDYLLGKLGAEESGACESIWFESDEDTELLEAARSELIDDYLIGELPAGEKHDFEHKFLITPRNLELVAVAKIHRGLLDEKTVREFDRATVEKEAVSLPIGFRQKIAEFLSLRTLQFALAASVVLIAVGLLVVRQGVLPNRGGSNIEVAQVEPSLAPERSDANEASPEPSPDTVQTNTISNNHANSNLKLRETPTPVAAPSPKAQKTLSSVVTLALATGFRDGSAATPTLNLTNDTKTARLRFAMPGLTGEYDSFALRLVNEKTDRVVWQSALPDLSLQLKGKTLAANVPASVLKDGEYRLMLIGTGNDSAEEILSRFAFKVNQK